VGRKREGEKRGKRKEGGKEGKKFLLGLRKKRRVYHLWKKGQVTQEEYRGLVRSCREEIRKAKAHLELRLTTVVRDNKKMFLQIH